MLQYVNIKQLFSSLHFIHPWLLLLTVSINPTLPPRRERGIWGEIEMSPSVHSGSLQSPGRNRFDDSSPRLSIAKDLRPTS